MDASAAINEAVDYAIQHDFLEGFFKEQKMYILTNLLTEFDQELHDRCTREAGYEEGVADGEARGRASGLAEGEARGRASGLAEGAQQNAIANAKNALDMGLTPEQIAQITSLPLEQVLALKNEMAHA